MKIWLAVLIALSVNNAQAALSDTLKDTWKKAIEVVDDLGASTIKSLDSKCLGEHQTDACLVLGKLYDYKKQEPIGEKYYLEACKNKSAEGCLLGGYNLERQGLENRSNDLYTMGCLQATGGGQSCVALGQNSREQRDWKGSMKYYEMACERDNGQGCFFAHEISMFAQNHTKGKWKYLLTKGCKLGHASSCYSLAQYAQSYDDKATARWGYQQACTKDILEACDDFKILNEGGILEKWWQKHRIDFINFREQILFKLEEILPAGPSLP